MTFDRPAARPRRENVVPMINVVFLLLIFFMISSELAPPPPIEIQPPAASGAAVQPAGAPAGETLYLAADGTLALGALRGEAALAALAPGTAVTLRADARLPASEAARLLARLSARGLGPVTLATSAAVPGARPLSPAGRE